MTPKLYTNQCVDGMLPEYEYTADNKDAPKGGENAHNESSQPSPPPRTLVADCICAMLTAGR